MKPSIARATLTAAFAAALWTTPVMAQHEHGSGAGHDDHAHETVAKAKSFGEASRRIADTIIRIRTSLDGGSLTGVSDDANSLAELAKQLGALALSADSGIARDKVKEANLAGKDLAATASELHESADKGDLAASRAQFEKVAAAASRIEAFAPAAYFCPMHCEGEKTYDRPGVCPVCKMDLKKQTTERFTVDVTPRGGAIEAGKPVALGFTLKDPRGMQVKEVESVHEKPLHLLMVSKDLSWFAHEHPAPQSDGTFALTWTFPAGGEYTLFHDFTPKGVGMQVVPVTIKVDGAPRAATPLKPDADGPRTVDGYTIALDTGGPVTTGGGAHLAYTITKDGKPVTDLAPYLGAMGHLVIISADLKEFVHSHPHEGGDHAGSAAKGGPKVDFEAHFKAPGVYKAWAQFNVGTTAKERVLTVPFTFEVAPGAGGSHEGHGDAEHKHGPAAVNAVCPMTGDKVNPFHSRDFKGQTVAFCDGDCALRWDGLSDEARMAKLVAAIAGTTPKTPHGAHAAGTAAESGHEADDDGMPDDLSLDEARKLYLVAGGAYTDADIKANGSTTAYEKFKGQMAKHDAKPKVGDLLCPISMTKANPKFSWVIGGKTYQFCCPPCIDEYVLLAKEHPEELKAPSEFVKK
jgi:YHS domain-containing protein